MKTIAESQIEQAAKLGAKYIEMTSVWDVHHSSMTNNRSNAFCRAEDIIDSGRARKVVAVVGAKGRSQHSSSEVLLFDVSSLDDEGLADLSALSNSCNVAYYEKADKGIKAI